jgi:hypothetical protein
MEGRQRLEQLHSSIRKLVGESSSAGQRVVQENLSFKTVATFWRQGGSVFSH